MPLALGDWRLVVLDSGERHEHASSGYNQRRAECARACELLGIEHPARSRPSARSSGCPSRCARARAHVLGENAARARGRGRAARGELPSARRAARRLPREPARTYEVSTPAVEAAVARLLEAGASGARMIGGGFGGSVLGLFAPGVGRPPGAREVRPGAGARVLERGEGGP